MSEFKIKVSVELDSSDLESKLKALGKEQEIELKLNTDKIEGQLKNLKKSFKDTFKLDGQVINDLNKISKALDKFNKSTDLNGGGKTATNQLISDYKELYNLSSKLQKQMAKGGLGGDSIERTSKQINQLKQDMNALYNQMSDAQKQSIDLFNTKQTNKAMVDMNSYLNKIETQASSLQNKLKSVSFDHIDVGKIDLISAKLEEIQAKAREGIDLDFKDIGDIVNDLGKLSTVINDLAKVENLASSFERISGSISDVNGDVERFQNTLKDLENSATKLDGSFDRAFSGANNELKEMNSNARRVSNETRNLGNGLLGTWDDFKGNFAQFTLAEIAGDFITDGIRTLARGFKDTIVETDGAITDLNKVYEKGLKGDNLKQYLGEFTEIAKQTGKSSVDVIQGTTQAIQSGISDLDQALVFARQSAILSNVGDIDQDSANTMLASIMSAYGGVENSLKPIREQVQGMGKDYNTLTKFMDLANHAGNNYAVTTADVGEALRQSSSALQANGVSMEESVGMAVAMNEILQDASRSGNALKSLSASMAGVNINAKTGQMELTKAGKALKEYAGIEVWDKQTGDIKNMYDVMDELSTKWTTLSKDQQTALGTAIAGKTQLTAFNALLSNWDTAKQVVAEYKDGLTIGSAERENTQYLDSVAGKWNAIKENMKSVALNLISTDSVKGFLDAIVSITDALAKLSSSELGAGLLGFTTLATGVGLATKAFKGLKAVFGTGGTLGRLLNVGDATADIAQTVVASRGLSNTFKTMGSKIKGTVTSLGLFSSIGSTAMTTLTAGAIGYIGYVMAMDKYQTAMSKKRIAESRETISNMEQEIRSQQGVLDSVRGIAEEYDKLSTKSNKTAEEQQRYAELTNQVAQIFPELVSGYNEAGDPILKLNGSLESYIGNLDKALDKQKRLLDNEEDELANELEKQMNKGQYLNKLLQTEYGKRGFETAHPNLSKYLDKQDYQGYIDLLKKERKAEDDWYKERLEAVQNYEQAKNDVREKYRNKLEENSKYKRGSDEDKQEQQAILDMLDLYNTGEAGANKLIKNLARLDDELVSTTEQMGEHAEGINKLEEQYEKGSKNLSQYTDGMIDFYEQAGKMDVESFSNLMSSIKDYAETTGDMAGANAQVAKLSEYLGTISNMDSGIWEKALKINAEPIEVAQQKLDNFLNAYGTGSQHLGKGGLADKLEQEFQVLRDLPMEFAEEAIRTEGKISAEFALEATVDAGTSIQEAVKGLLANDNLIDPQELSVLMQVVTEIENQGEISAETEQLLRDVLPDEIEDEVISKIKVEADIQGEQEVDAFLQKIKLNEKVEQEIRANVNGKEEVEGLYQAIEKMPEEKQLNAVANYGKIKDEAYLLQASLEDIPTETLVSVVAEMDDAQIKDFAQVIDELGGKRVSAFLQTEGATEALMECENVQQMLDLINGKTTIAEIEAKNNGKEEIEQTKQDLEEIDGKTSTATVDVENNGKEEVEQTKQDLEEIDGKNATSTVTIQAPMEQKARQIKEELDELDGKNTTSTINVEANGKEEIEQTKQSLNELDGKTTTSTITIQAPMEQKARQIKQELDELDGTNANPTINVEANGKEEVEQTKQSIESLPSTKEVVISIAQSGANVLDSIANWINSKAEQNIEIKAKVAKVDTSALDNIKAKDVDIKAKVGKVDTSALDGIKSKDVEVSAKVTGLDQVNSLKTALSSLQNKAISITVGGNALGQVNQIKSALVGIQSKSISITASGNALGQINTIKSSLNGLQSKAISISASVSGTNQVNALKVAIAGLQGKSVSVTASTSGTDGVNALTSAIGRVQGKSVSVTANVSGTSAVNALTSAINRVKSKSVKVSASVSGTGAVQSLASAIASVRSKTVSVRVNKTISTTTQSVGGSSVGYATPSDVSLANIPVTSSDSVNISSPTPMVTSFASSSSGISLSKILPSINFDIDIFKNLEESLSKLESQLNVIDKRMNLAFGDEKIKLLQQQIPLLKQQQAIQEKIIQRERDANGQLTSWLKSQGFKFDNLGNITNYVDKLLAMETNVENLKKKYDDLNDAKKKNENATKNAQKAYESANKTLDTAKKYLQEYFDTNSDNVNEAVAKWTEYQIAIEETKQKIREYERELKALTTDSRRKDNERDIAMVENRLELLKAQIEGAEDEEKKNALMQTRIKLTEQLKKETSDLLEYEQRYKNEIMKELNQYGFKFRQDGSIEGYGTKIQELKKTLSEVEFDYVFEKVEEYLEQTQSVIPELIIDLQELQNEIQDVNKDIEKTIKTLEKEIKGLREDSRYKDNERDIAMVENLLKMNQALIDQTNGSTEEISLLQERINLTRRLQKENNDLLAYEEERRKMLMSDLSSYGFTFRDDGSMAGYGGIIENLKKTLEEEEFDEVFAKVEDYLKTTIETIPSLQIEFEELNAEIEETAKKIRDFEKEIKELREDSRYKDNERDISEVENLLKLNQALIDQADGSSKEVSLLQERISLTRRLQKENNDLLAYEEERRKMLMSDLGSYGFTFRTDGSMVGYGGIIEELKRTLSEEEFDEVFKNVEDYLETTFQTIPDLQTEFENLNGEIEEMEDEVRELARQQELFASTNAITELTNQYEELSHTLGLIEEQMKYAYGVDKLKLMEESVEIINKQLDVQLEKLKQTEDQMAIYQRELDDYGFTFDDKGNIKNYKDIMEFYRSSDDVEDLLNITQEYFDLQSELKDITSDYASLGNQIKDIYKDQLEITQQIEGEITDIITKEFEERKKEAEEYAEEYANTRIKMLEEERKAYQAMRDAQDYDESVEDQLKEIEVLRKQIETAKRDTSISGQKRLSELTKELAEAEKRLADITQEQIDKDFDSNITDEIDKIESEKEQILDALEKEFDEKLSEENIAKIVQEALSSGFIELNGEIQSIQSLLLNSIDESADGYSAMAEVIKNELVANLNIALDTMRELENINSTLGLQSFDIANSVSTTPINTPEHSSNSGNNITIGDTNITVTGSVDDITLTKIEEMIQDSQDKMLSEITANL